MALDNIPGAAAVTVSLGLGIDRRTLKHSLQAAGFIAVWMGIGVGLRFSGMEPIAYMHLYLLVGIPLMILFQCGIRKERLVTLWVRDARRFQIGIAGLFAGAVLAAPAAYQLFAGAVPRPMRWIAPLYFMAAIVGAFGTGFALRKTPLYALRKGLPSFLIATAFGLGMMALAGFASGKLRIPNAWLFVQQFVLLLTVCFSLEEVVFRGMLDSHLQPLPATGLSAWVSAFTVSVLWGLWHLPIIPIPDLVSAIVIVPVVAFVHVLIGVPLSFCWRSSGSLLLPSVAHALVDAFRNTAVM
jgi:membrane protease YdiL (CAAX protease family)